MNRREAISAVALLLGGTVIGADLLVACSPKPKHSNVHFDQDHISLLDEVGDTILPPTSTPGAKSAQIGNFMAIMIQDCYTPKNQQIFLEGIQQLRKVSMEKYDKDFMKLDALQRTDMLIALDKEQRDYMKQKKQEEPAHYFRMMKELTLLGYFTSEAGATKALRYVPIPGKYDGCMPYKKGDKAWAT
jgi:hypothetical protein